jgi:ribonuclease Z
MRFDAGLGTSMRLAQVGVMPVRLNAIFFTHVHSDHTDGFADLVQLRWHYASTAPKLDVVCSADTVSALGFTISCNKLAAHIGDAYFYSGEIASDNRRTGHGRRADLPNWST